MKANSETRSYGGPSVLFPADEVLAGVPATEDEVSDDKDPENSHRQNNPLQPIQHRELLTIRFVQFF